MKYFEIVKHYESCLDRYGDTCKGVDWPNDEDAERRYKVMAEMLPSKGGKVLDFGCGTARFLDYIKAKGIANLDYHGLDVSKKFIQVCQEKYPNEQFVLKDVHQESLTEDFDYIICNGTFTEKTILTQDEMWGFFTATLKILWEHAAKGVAFNLMSKQVDWEREDLFHVGLDQIAEFLVKNISRHFVIRNDYRLYEYTVYVYSENHYG